MWKMFPIFAVLIGSGIPASVNWSEIGHVTVHVQGERFMRDVPVGGPVEKLRLDAVGSDIFCRSVQETLVTDVTQDLFQGILQNNRPLDIDLSGTEHNIQTLTFQCGTLTDGTASIRVFVVWGCRHNLPAT